MMDNLSIAHKKSRAFALGIDGAFAQDVLTDALRVHVGRGKAHSLDTLSHLTGIKRVTLKGYQAGENCPSLSKLMRLMAVLDPCFSHALVSVVGFSGLRRIEERTIDIGELCTIFADITAMTATMAQDGRLDHIERTKLKAHLVELIRILSEYVCGL